MASPPIPITSMPPISAMLLTVHGPGAEERYHLIPDHMNVEQALRLAAGIVAQHGKREAFEDYLAQAARDLDHDAEETAGL